MQVKQVAVYHKTVDKCFKIHIERLHTQKKGIRDIIAVLSHESDLNLARLAIIFSLF